MVNYTKLNRCFAAKYRFLIRVHLFGCIQISLELQYCKKDDNRVLFTFLEYLVRSTGMSMPDMPRRKLFITSKAHTGKRDCKTLLRIPRGGCKQFLCCGNRSFWREVSFGLLFRQPRKKRKDTLIFKEAKNEENQ